MNIRQAKLIYPKTLLRLFNEVYYTSIENNRA